MISPPAIRKQKKFLSRVRNILHVVLKDNEFIKKKYQKSGITFPSQISSWTDFLSIPLISRKELALDQKNFPPYGTNLSKPSSEYGYVLFTSGTTTGRPLYLPLTSSEFSRFVDVMEHGDRLLGISNKDVFCHLTPSYVYPISYAAIQRIGARMIPTGIERYRDLLKKLGDLQVSIFQAYPNVLFQLIELAEKMKFDLKKLSIKKLITVGERGGGIPSVKTYLEKKWNAKVIDHIGSIEGAMTAIQCPSNPEDYHLLADYFIPEVLDIRTRKPAKFGELVLTFLWRVDFPLIRYRTGDLVEIDYSKCLCGNSSPRLKGGVLGRTDGLLKLRAGLIYPEEIEASVMKYTKVRSFEIFCTQENGVDVIDVFIELPLSVSFEYFTSIKRDLENTLGFPPRIYPLLPNTLPRPLFEKAKRFHDFRNKSRVVLSESSLGLKMGLSPKLFKTLLYLKNKKKRIGQLISLLK